MHAWVNSEIGHSIDGNIVFGFQAVVVCGLIATRLNSDPPDTIMSLFPGYR